MSMSRRVFVGMGASIAGAGLLPPGPARAQGAAKPHFMLEIFVRPGWDPSYIFDARPLAMRAAGIAHSYFDAEPTELRDARGGRTLVTQNFAALAEHFNAGRFSILNGVHMAASFDGHEQNLNFALTGNPFGGESQMPHLNAGAGAAPLDYLQLGQLYGINITNGAKSAPLDARSGERLVRAVAAQAPIAPESPVVNYLLQRLAVVGGGDGAFSRGARTMRRGLGEAGGLAERLKAIELEALPEDGSEVPLRATLKYLHQCFASGVVHSALIELDRDLDTHDPVSAKKQPETYRKVADELAELLTFLANTPLSATDPTPLLECTTLLITSEFGRTLRQAGQAIDDTGTDHNPLANTVLLAGRGIQGGLIIGAGDQEAAFAPVAAAHKGFDLDLVKVMGKPFDFDAMLAVAALPEAYDAANYLTFASVANSIYALFGVDSSRYWKLGRNAPAARVLGPALITV